MRQIRWDAITDTKGTLWGTKRTDITVLKGLFPDLKALFTEKETVKKGGAAGAPGEGGEVDPAAPPKPVKIMFVEGKRAQNMALSLAGSFVCYFALLVSMWYSPPPKHQPCLCH